MPCQLTETQLLAVLTEDQLAEARSQAAGACDPVAEAIGFATARVDTYTYGFDAPAAMLTGYARALAAWEIAARLGTPTETLTNARDTAMKELEGIRDGKFPGLVGSASAPSLGTIYAGGGKAAIPLSI